MLYEVITLMLIANDISPKKDYIDFAFAQCDYIFGANPMSTSYVVITSYSIHYTKLYEQDIVSYVHSMGHEKIRNNFV